MAKMVFFENDQVAIDIQGCAICDGDEFSLNMEFPCACNSTFKKNSSACETGQEKKSSPKLIIDLNKEPPLEQAPLLEKAPVAERKPLNLISKILVSLIVVLCKMLKFHTSFRNEESANTEAVEEEKIDRVSEEEEAGDAENNIPTESCFGSYLRSAAYAMIIVAIPFQIAAIMFLTGILNLETNPYEQAGFPHNNTNWYVGKM